MSVLIKGFDMPKDGCKDCVMVERGFVSDVCPFLKREVNGNVKRGGKPNGCPLIEVPDTNVGDIISRQAAIDEMEKAKERYFDRRVIIGKMQDIVNNLPSAQPEQQWISVSERLPEDLEEVNVTWVNHDPEPYYDFAKDKPCSGSAVYYKGSWYWYSSTCVDILAEYGRNEMDKIDDGVEVLAWMPLPEPWKGEDDADHSQI